MFKCRVEDNIYDIEQILEEYYDPDIEPLTEQELKEIMEEFGKDTAENVIEKIMEEYYDPSVTPLSQDELEEIILKYGDDTFIVDDEGATEALEKTVANVVIEDKNDFETESRTLELQDSNANHRPRKRGVRRGGRGKRRCKDKVEMKILQTNCDGFTSKKESIENIVNDRQTDVLLLNETALKGKRKVKMKDYFSFGKNRIKAKGGVSTVVANYLKPYTVKVGEGKEEDDEYVIIRLDHVIPALNIINIYGSQESRTPNDDVLESWTRLEKDLDDIVGRGEAFLIMGDLNRAVGSDEWGVDGNHDKVSYGGQLVRNMIKERNCTVLNNMAEGGPWTWFQRGKENIKSCLDLAICSSNLLPFVKTVVIDKDRRFTPRRVIWKKQKFSSVYTDHLPLEVVLCGMPRRNTISLKSTAWNLGKPGGWESYKDMTDSAANDIENIVLNEEMEIDKVIKKIETVNNDIKFKAFGKTRVSRNKTKSKIVTSESDADEELIKKQTRKIEKEILQVKSQKPGRVGMVFKMKELINGPKKAGQEPTAIRNPKTNELIVSNEEIKKVTLAYCVENLSKKNVGQVNQLRNTVNELRLNSSDEEGFEVGKDDFNEVIRKFQSKATKSYDFLLKAGGKYQDVMHKLCKRIIENEEFPASFRKTILFMIWKQKGPAEVLKNSRFIHMKEGFLPRTCEALVVGKMKESILDSSSKYQVGGQPGHFPEEHLFTVKSVWAKLEKDGKGMIVTLVDIVSFFDREDIGDVMDTLWKIGVNKKAARVWFRLNQGTEIAVKTATGVTDTAVVGDCIGQGTAGAALVSQANLDCGLMEYFANSEDEISYGEVRLQPMAYQDDIMRSSQDVLSTQVGNIKLATMFEEKGLEAHPDKTCFIICGNQRYRKDMESDLQRNPITFGSFAVKQKECDRYLGQMLHGGGLDKSAEATVQERMGRIKGAALEIRNIIEEFPMQAIAGMMAAWTLWERALIPSLLSGAGTWIGLKNNSKVIEMCDSTQNFFWRVMLTVPESCPKVALRCETNMLGMKWRIWLEKILLLVRIRNQDSTSLSRQIYEESKAKGWPGLGEEVGEICGIIDIPNVNDVAVSKSVIKQAIWDNHYADMKKELEGSKKLEAIKDEDFHKTQDYFYDKCVENTRMAFKIRSQMVSEIPGNFKRKFKQKGEEGLMCPYCQEGQIMTQTHCLQCPAWAEQREGLQLNNIEDMVVFFRKLLVERARLDKENVFKTASHDSHEG